MRLVCFFCIVYSFALMDSRWARKGGLGKGVQHTRACGPYLGSRCPSVPQPTTHCPLWSSWPVMHTHRAYCGYANSEWHETLHISMNILKCISLKFVFRVDGVGEGGKNVARKDDMDSYEPFFRTIWVYTSIPKSTSQHVWTLWTGCNLTHMRKTCPMSPQKSSRCLLLPYFIQHHLEQW